MGKRAGTARAVAQAEATRPSCPCGADTPVRLLLTLVLTLPLTPELRGANCPGRSDSDAAGQFVGKRAGSATAVAQAGAKRRPEPAKAQAALATRPDQNKSGCPQAARLVLAEAR